MLTDTKKVATLILSKIEDNIEIIDHHSYHSTKKNIRKYNSVLPYFDRPPIYRLVFSAIPRYKESFLIITRPIEKPEDFFSTKQHQTVAGDVGNLPAESIFTSLDAALQNLRANSSKRNIVRIAKASQEIIQGGFLAEDIKALITSAEKITLPSGETFSLTSEGYSMKSINTVKPSLASPPSPGASRIR